MQIVFIEVERWTNEQFFFKQWQGRVEYVMLTWTRVSEFSTSCNEYLLDMSYEYGLELAVCLWQNCKDHSIA